MWNRYEWATDQHHQYSSYHSESWRIRNHVDVPTAMNSNALYLRNGKFATQCEVNGGAFYELTNEVPSCVHLQCFLALFICIKSIIQTNQAIHTIHSTWPTNLWDRMQRFNSALVTFHRIMHRSNWKITFCVPEMIISSPFSMNVVVFLQWFSVPSSHS